MPAYVFEIVIPGTWLDYEDREWANRVEPLLSELESQFMDANLALNFFTQSQNVDLRPPSREEQERQWNRQREIQRAVGAELGLDDSHEAQQHARFEAEVRFKREQWAAGKAPMEFENKTAYLYAKAFLYALDGFGKFLKVLSKTEGVPGELVEQFKQMSAVFSDLIGVRNTAQHLEDRARHLGEPAGRGKPPNPLILKPLDNDFAKAPAGGVLMLSHLKGTRYGSTMADGHYGEVDVSPESMEKLRTILHAVLHAFKWKGPRRHLPSA